MHFAYIAATYQRRDEIEYNFSNAPPGVLYEVFSKYSPLSLFHFLSHVFVHRAAFSLSANFPPKCFRNHSIRYHQHLA